jgi:intracellular septation protein
MGLLNLYVAHSFSTDTWVNFKLFGAMGLLIAFTVAQGLYLSRHLKDDEPPPAEPSKPAA